MVRIRIRRPVLYILYALMDSPMNLLVLTGCTLMLPPDYATIHKLLIVIEKAIEGVRSFLKSHLLRDGCSPDYNDQSKGLAMTNILVFLN